MKPCKESDQLVVRFDFAKIGESEANLRAKN